MDRTASSGCRNGVGSIASADEAKLQEILMRAQPGVAGESEAEPAITDAELVGDGRDANESP